MKVKGKADYQIEIAIGLGLYILECPICENEYVLLFLDGEEGDPEVQCVCGYIAPLWDWPYNVEVMELSIIGGENGVFEISLETEL